MTDPRALPTPQLKGTRCRASVAGGCELGEAEGREGQMGIRCREKAALRSQAGIRE